MRRICLLSLLLLAAVGCGPPNSGSDDTGVSDDAAESSGASYALASTVLGDENQTTFVRYMDELEAGEISLDNAREYSGYATIGGVGGMFFVARGDTPTITRFQVSDDGTLQEDGELSFSQYVDESPLYANTFASPTRAYLDQEDTGQVVWNPKEMTIEDAETVDQIPEKVDDLPAFRAFRRGTVVRGDLVFQPYHWRGPNFYEFASNSKIVVFDSTDDSVVNVIDAPCPGLDVGTKTDDGDIYFTNWVNATAAPVIDGESNSHAPCAVKIDAGSTELNDDWTKDLSTITDGREVAAARILDGSVAVASVLDHERVDPDSDTDPTAITRGNNWELWRIDLEAETASKVEGTGYIAGGYYAFRIDGRMVALLPNGEYSRTEAYEIPVDGEASKLFEVKGWVYQMVDL